MSAKQNWLKRAEWDENAKKTLINCVPGQKRRSKEAVEAYVIAMTDAIKERRDANDAAFKLFRQT